MQRKRLTITLANELVSALDETVDGELLRNRSQALEHFLKEGMGIHQLQYVFLFFPAEWRQETLEKIVTLCQPLHITSFFLVLSSETQSQQAEIEAIIHEWLPNALTKVVPADFGTGAAVLLQKSVLGHSFALITVSPKPLPDTLLPALVFHYHHQGILTSLTYTSNGETFESSGIVIADPELLHLIPAGLSSLTENVYPAVITQGKLRTYAFSA